MSKFTFFYNNRTPLSNWYPSTFEWGGIFFTRGEQYMMYRKAMLFGDAEVGKMILQTDVPFEQKALGRKVRNFNQQVWDQVKFDIMVVGLYEKFKQNPGIIKSLLETTGTELVEANPNDKIWGVGLSVSDPRILNKEEWLGENLLGKVLDKVREMLEKS